MKSLRMHPFTDSFVHPVLLSCLLPSLLILSGPAAAQGQRVPQQGNPPTQNVTQVFDRADSDGNGLLSIEEARVALPGLSIEDNNRDGWFNHAEAERAVPDLRISIGDSSRNAVVGEAGYLSIRMKVDGVEV